jgi:hypothetical protein
MTLPFKKKKIKRNYCSSQVLPFQAATQIPTSPSLSLTSMARQGSEEY